MIRKRLEEVAKILGKTLVSEKVVEGFAVDSRKVAPGSMFFALKGEKVDGHDFLREVRDGGAICAVVDKGYKGTVEGLPLIFVDHVLSSLQELAKFKMLEQKTRCIGITGSVGKTTTKEFMATLLEGSFKVEKTPGNENSQVGVPLSILHTKGEPEVFIAEMGMSQKGEIASLVSMIPPEIAVVTQVSLAHALYFPKGLEEVAEAKGEILSHFSTKKVFLNAQVSPFAAFYRRETPSMIFYGKEEGEVDVGVIFTDSGYRIRTKEGVTREFVLPFTAKHLVDNFLGAALVARELGVSWEDIFLRAANLKAYKMRFEKVEKEGVVYINDSYNANPASMKAALENMPKPELGGRVIAALGHMGELGVFSVEAHKEIGEIASLYADLLFCIGVDTSYMVEGFMKSGKTALQFSCFQEFKDALKKEIRQKDVVLVKASNSLKLWRVLDE
ncbi:MAG: UDP-N-acetylmuramoyl-tripeptide--D-alanyl-D-alanine ligase [Chlamydiota bacterium]